MVASLDRVRVIWEGTGTGSPISLGIPISARFAAPTSALNGLATTFLIEHTNTEFNEVEVARGVYTHSGATLARTTIIWSTNGGFGGSAVDFSAGVKHVSLGLSPTDLGDLVGLDQVTANEIATNAVTAVKILAGAVSYDKIAAASKNAVVATPTAGIFVLDDSNSGRTFRAEEAVEFEIANDVTENSFWQLIGRSSSVTATIEGDAGNIVFNGGNVDTVTLLNGYEARLTVESNAGTAPNVSASGGFSGAQIVPAGQVDFQDNLLIRPALQDYAEISTSPTNSGGTVVLNLTLGNAFQHTLTANITTLTISNPPASGRAGSFVLKITQDSTPRTISWPASVDWAGGVAPTLSTGSGDVDIMTFITWDAGTRWFGMVGGQDFS